MQAGEGLSYVEDPGARHVTWDRLNRNGVGQFNSLVYPGAQDATKGAAHGLVRRDACDEVGGCAGCVCHLRRRVTTVPSVGAAGDVCA